MPRTEPLTLADELALLPILEIDPFRPEAPKIYAHGMARLTYQYPTGDTLTHIVFVFGLTKDKRHIYGTSDAAKDEQGFHNCASDEEGRSPLENLVSYERLIVYVKTKPLTTETHPQLKRS